MTKSVIRSWRWRDTSRLSVCNWSSWSCLRSCKRDELVLSVRRALAGVLASEGRVELDEMALELGRRHIAVVLQNPSRRELWRRRFLCCNKAVVVAPTHGPHGPLLLQAIGHQLHRKCGSWIVRWWSNDVTIVYCIRLHMEVCFDWWMNVSLFVQSNPACFTANERCSDSK